MPDFSTSPYFDDYNAQKNFMKILFNAGRPVQARELNQIQSMQNHQNAVMASNLFKNGTRILGGSPKFNSVGWVRLNTGADISWYIQNSIAIGDGSGAGDGSGVEARIIGVSPETATDPATLFVVYTKTGVDGETIKFLDGEQIRVLSADRTTELTVASKRPKVRCPTCPSNSDVIASDATIKPTGLKAKQLVIDAGVWYWNGWFVDSPHIEYIYDKYNLGITAKIGFDIVENIVTHDDDASLLDNALGYPNETASGADRYQIEFIINTRQSAPQDGDKFIQICELKDGVVIDVVKDTQYNKIMDVMAQRTYEESGNYTVKPFSIKYIDHKAPEKDIPTGANVNGNPDYLRAIVSEGLAYVMGYRHEKTHPTFFDVKKARDTVKSEDGIIFFEEPAYVDLVVADDANAWMNSSGSADKLYTDEGIELHDNVLSGTTGTGNKIGEMRVWDARKVGKTAAGKDIYRYYVSEIKMEPNKKYSEIKSVTNTATNFAAVPEKGFQIINESQKSLFWPVNTPMIKSMREVNNPDTGSVIINRRLKLNATLDSTGKYTWTSTTNLFSGGMETAILSVKTGGVWKTIDHTKGGVLSPAGTSISVDLGGSNAGDEVMLVVTAITVNLVEKTKTLVEKEIKIINEAGTNSFATALNLGKADVIKVRSVKGDGTTDITDFFRLDNGQTPTAYREAKLINIKPIAAGTFGAIHVEFDYFQHSDTAQSGFFTVDSYEATIAAKNDYDYGNLPPVFGADGREYQPVHIIDFRPLVLGNSISSSYMPAVNTTLIHDAESYVPRKDLVLIDKDGNIYNQKGIPAHKPEFPKQPPNTMVLFQVLIPAYTYSYRDVRVTKVENKRYTMRDIGNLENRINNLEYYSTLSLSEKAISDANITDTNGLERFKNGFIVDNFVDYSVADTRYSEFRAIKDEVSRCLRPNTSMFNRQLDIDVANSSNFINRGGVITLPYEHEMVDEQPFATKSVVVAECFVSKKVGTLKLSPNNNTWSDVTREAKQEWNIDTGVEAIQGLSNQINRVQKDFNDFQIANATVTTPTANVTMSTRSSFSTRERSVGGSWSTTTSSASAGGGTTITTNFNSWSGVATDTIRTDTRVATVTAEESRIMPKTTNYSFDRVTDVKILPYMKETLINFHASGLLPNTKLYIFFDDVDITEFASNGMPNDVDKVLSSDANGVCSGRVLIPEGRFLNGTKIMKISNDKTNSGDEDMEMCVAKAQFYAGGVDITKQEIDLNIVTPTLSMVETEYSQDVPNTTTSTVVETTTRVTSSSSFSTVSHVPPPPRVNDPLAQSFTLNFDGFISKMDLFFHLKDANENTPLFLEIRKMENGYPSATRILGRKDFYVKDIAISEDASVPTTVEFDTPIFVTGGEEHCFVVGCDSPTTKLWVAKLGGKAVNYGGKFVDTQPSLGSRFRSQNGRTWTTEQFEDIMYKLYVCKFSDQPMKLQFKLKYDDIEKLAPYPFECERATKLIRVHTQNGHGFIPNDKVIISTLEGKWVKVKLTSGKIMSGHKITANNGTTAEVVQVKYPDTDKTVAEILLKNVVGHMEDGEPFTSNSFSGLDFEKDLFINGSANSFTAPVCGGKLEGNPDIISGSVNGIPLTEINKEHTVHSVEDDMTFTIEVASNATDSGRFGYEDVRAKLSQKFEMCNLSGSVMIYDGTEEWSMKALKHGAVNTIHEGDNYGYGDVYTVQRNENVFLERPYKISSEINTETFAAGKSSVVYTAKLTREPSKPYVSPILNLDTMSITALSHHVSWKSEDKNKIAPNVDESFYEENDPVKGSELYKYISKTVTLAKPAKDLKIWFDVNKPLYTDFDVYIKTSEASGQAIDDLPWMKLGNYEKEVTHNDAEKYTEIEILTSEVLSTPLEMFSAFKVKIVGRSKNLAKYPKFKALRIVALT